MPVVQQDINNFFFQQDYRKDCWLTLQQKNCKHRLIRPLPTTSGTRTLLNFRLKFNRFFFIFAEISRWNFARMLICLIVCDALSENKLGTYGIFTYEIKFLTLSWRRALPYRNRSIGLHSKSMNWFLYERDHRHERVKLNQNINTLWTQDTNWGYIRRSEDNLTFYQCLMCV